MKTSEITYVTEVVKKIEIEIVDLDTMDEDAVAAALDSAYHPELEGVLIRLAAGIGSVASRRDCQTGMFLTDLEDLPTRESYQSDKTAKLTWWSMRGVWGRRGWYMSATVNTQVSLQYGDTYYEFDDDVQFTVAGKTGTTTFLGQALGPAMARLWSRAMARRAIRNMFEADLPDENYWPADVSQWLADRAEFLACAECGTTYPHSDTCSER